MSYRTQAGQARRLLDEKYADGTIATLRARPRSGWIRAVRTALGMSQDAVAQRLGVTRAAVTGLERAERDGAITIAKLFEVAAALDCTLVYALVPNTSLEQTVQRQAARVVDRRLEYVNATMALEDQAVGTAQQDYIRADQIAEIIQRGELWKAP
jgi:predicted DNA-binding mobile mystery protein A